MFGQMTVLAYDITSKSFIHTAQYTFNRHNACYPYTRLTCSGLLPRRCWHYATFGAGEKINKKSVGINKVMKKLISREVLFGFS